jgi:hypothetical protein
VVWTFADGTEKTNRLMEVGCKRVKWIDVRIDQGYLFRSVAAVALEVADFAYCLWLALRRVGPQFWSGPVLVEWRRKRLKMSVQKRLDGMGSDLPAAGSGCGGCWVFRCLLERVVDEAVGRAEAAVWKLPGQTRKMDDNEEGHSW